MATFGYETIGSSTGTQGANAIRGANGLPASNGMATSMSFYARTGFWTSGKKVKLALYDAADNSFIAETEEREDGGNGWQVFNFDSPVEIFSAKTYILAVYCDTSIGVHYNAESGEAYPSDTGLYPTWPNPVSTSTSYQYSTICTYIPAAAYYHGLKVQGVGELALCDAVNNPLRIRKGGVTYGIELVDISDPNASKIRIKTGAGIKAIRRYT